MLNSLACRASISATAARARGSSLSRPAATLDRFVLFTLRVTYDRDLERDLARGALSESQADELLAWVDTLRTRIAEHRLRRVASTRLVVNGVAAMRTGKTLADVKTRYFQDWSADELAKAEGR
jgi:hypothetical protein